MCLLQTVMLIFSLLSIAQKFAFAPFLFIYVIFQILDLCKRMVCSPFISPLMLDFLNVFPFSKAKATEKSIVYVSIVDFQFFHFEISLKVISASVLHLTDYCMVSFALGAML